MPRLPLSASELTAQITLQVRASGEDMLGGAAGAWGALATGVWAKPEPLRSREFFAAGATQTGVDTRFSLRHMPGLVPGMRVLWQGRAFDLVGEPIDVDGAGHTIELMCASTLRNPL